MNESERKVSERRSFREWLADSEIALGVIAVVLAGIAFTLAPVFV